MPMFDQGARDGDGRRQQQAGPVVVAVPDQRRVDLLEGEPARVLQLAIDLRRVGLGDRAEAEHQRAGERPGLRTEIAAMPHAHLRLFQHLARHRLLQRLAGLDETGDHRVAPGGPGRLPPQQQALAIADGDDHGRVDAGIVVLAAVGAMGDVARAPERDGAAAGAAEARGGLPVQQRARHGEHARIEGGPCRRRAAQVDPAGRIHRMVPRIGGEPGLAVLQAEEQAGSRTAAQRRARHRGQHARLVRQCTPVLVEQQHACGRPQPRQRLGIVTQRIGAIQRIACEGEAGQRNGESDRTCHGTRQAGVHMLKLLPQPQVVLALGLRITNCAPCRLSL